MKNFIVCIKIFKLVVAYLFLVKPLKASFIGI